MQERVVETKTCKHCSVNFQITDKDLEFYEKVSPIFGGKKYLIPPPTLCPDCRQQRRLSFRNERKLYKRKCDFSGKEIVSVYSPDKQYIVYDREIWNSDVWNPLEYYQEYDFSMSFFHQFHKLLFEVPSQSLIQKNSDNSEYSHDVFSSKNLFLSYVVFEGEDCLYSNNIFWSKNCIDCYWVSKSEFCYQCVEITGGYNLSFAISCFNCSDSSYLMDCEGIKFSHFCVGLANTEYSFLNKKYSKKKYKEMLYKLNVDNEFFLSSLDAYMKLQQKVPKKNLQMLMCEESIGDNISYTKNSSCVYDSHNIRDSKYIFQGGNLDSTMDVSINGDNKTHAQIYESISAPGCSNIGFLNGVWYSRNILYSMFLFHCSDCFGCVGLRNKSYCILNKQYTKEEYEALVPKIIEHMMTTGEWGEFFPSSMSPFGYNETVAQEYYPLPHPNPLLRSNFEDSRASTPVSLILGEERGQNGMIQFTPFSPKGEGLGVRFNWSTYESPPPKVDKVISADKLPQNIEDIPDDILNWAIECEVTKKPFRIIQQELEFYRKHKLPIPRRHPDQRHLDRMALRNPRKLYERTCDKCHKQIQTTYAPERPEIVYCETCYNKEVY